MTWSYTVYDTVFTNADFDGQAYVDGLPKLLEKFVQHAGNFYVGSSTSSVVLGTGSKSLTVETSKPYQAGTPLRIASSAAPSTNFMEGVVTSYNSGTGALVVDVISAVGSGTIASWSVNIGGGTVAGGSPVSIAQGGTGATTAANARANLGLATSPTFAGTISAANYAGTGTLSSSNSILAGIGTTFPYKFQVNTNAANCVATGLAGNTAFFAADGAANTIMNVNFAAFGTFNNYRYNGTAAATTGILSGDILGAFTSSGYTGAGIGSGGSMRTIATETWSGSAGGSAIYFETTKNTTTTRTEKMRIDGSGVLTVGPNGLTNPSFIVDGSAASSATGLQIVAAASGGGISLNAISSGTNENILINTKGNGIVSIRSSNASTSVTASSLVALKQVDATVNNTSGLTFANSAAFTTSSIVGVHESHAQSQGSLVFNTGTAGGVVTTAMKIDSTQRVLVGHTAAISTGVSAGMQLTGIGADAFLSISRYSADVSNGGIICYKSRGASKGTQAAVVNGDGLGEVDFAGYDGTSAVISSYIQAVASAAVSTGIIPTTINFKTMTAAGAINVGLAISHTQGVSVPNGTFTPHQTFGIVGTNAVNNAQAGSVGERITNSASVSVATSTPTTITSISLTAGDWEIFGNFYWTTPNATTVSLFYGSVSGTTNSIAVSSSGGFNAFVGAAFTGDGSSISGLDIPPIRVNISSSSTRYLTFQHNGATAITITGNIRAIRVR